MMASRCEENEIKWEEKCRPNQTDVVQSNIKDISSYFIIMNHSIFYRNWELFSSVLCLNDLMKNTKRYLSFNLQVKFYFVFQRQRRRYNRCWLVILFNMKWKSSKFRVLLFSLSVLFKSLYNVMSRSGTQLSIHYFRCCLFCFVLRFFMGVVIKHNCDNIS